MINNLSDSEIRKLRQLLRSVPCNGITTYVPGDGISITDTNCCHVKQISTAPAYRVYTALLTQSGESSTLYISSDSPSPLVVGVTYTITFNDGTGDFTNIGAPNNTVGTSFVATGTTPANWGTPGDVEVSYNTGAPVVTVLENTLGDITWTYSGDGFYIGTSSGLFIEDKTAIFISGSYGSAGDPNSNIIFYVLRISDNEINVFSSTNGTLANDYLGDTPIEIRVYD